jgi:HD-GYP domain-containing protein (c-di-GMP phosphodiesterase class II)
MLRPIDPSSIRPGISFPKPVFSRRGVKLLAADMQLTDTMCDALNDLALTRVNGRTTWNLLLADSPDQLAQAGLITKVPGPAAGRTASADYVSSHGVLAVATGDTVQQLHAEALFGGAFIDADSRESRRHRAARMKLADELVEQLEPAWQHLPLAIRPGTCPLDLAVSDVAGWPQPARLERFRAARIDQTRQLFTRILAGEPFEVAEPLALIDELVTLLVRYPSRYPELAFPADRRCDQLADHAYTAATLAVMIAARLKWDEQDVNCAGLAALLADTGMMLVPRRALHAARGLTEVEVNQVWRHPAFSVSLTACIAGVPETVRRALYQHHERENGGGYPNRLRFKKIGSLAKVVAVADAFAAATEPRPYRPAKHPSRALQELVHLASDKIFDRDAARSLVHGVGLFPVGSWVRLSTGEAARVIAANPGAIDRPLVRVYQRRGGAVSAGPEIDLAGFEPWALHVVAPADDPERSALFARNVG